MDDQTTMALRDFLQGGAIFGFVGAILGHVLRNRRFSGAALGFFLWPLGWLVLLFLSDRRAKCPECLAAVDPRAKRCRHCGARLPVAGSEPSPAPQPATMKCPYCAAELLINSLRDGDNTCPACRKVFEIQ